MGRARASISAVALALTLSSSACASDPVCRPALAVRSFPDGAELARMDLAPEDEFSLSFLHSVTRRTVVDRYVLEGGRIVQTAEEFGEHGPGLPALGEEAGLTWERRDTGFAVTMRRHIPRLVVRADSDYANTLRGATSLDLAQWGRRAVEIVAADCGPRG